jgi:hypothetical protein
LEALEDRLVPSIAEGTILVPNSPANDYARGQTSYPSGIIGVDPNTGMPIAISVGAIYQVPQDVKEAPANTPNVPTNALFVADIQAGSQEQGAII